MKKGLTELVFILDRSGSMSSLTSDTINGFDSMIQKYKEELEEANVTTVLFDHEYNVIHDNLNLKEVKSIKDYYFARGATALYDAIGRTINSVGERLFNTPEEERPEKVIFVVTTDGEENSSKEFTRSKIKEMIEHQQTKYSWGFLFLGANIDAEKEAESIGISRDFAAKYVASSRGVSSVYDALVDAVSCYACSLDDISAANSVKSILNTKIVNDNSCDSAITLSYDFKNNDISNKQDTISNTYVRNAFRSIIDDVAISNDSNSILNHVDDSIDCTYKHID